MFVRINENVCVRDKCESWVNLGKKCKSKENAMAIDYLSTCVEIDE